jgi:hypothetical protein
MTSYRKAFEAMEDEVGQLLEDVAVTRAIEGYQAALLAGKPIKDKNGRLSTKSSTQPATALVLKRFA